MMDYKRKLAAVQAKYDSKVVVSCRTDLDSLHVEFHYIKPSFTLDKEELTIPQITIGLVHHLLTCSVIPLWEMR